MKSGARDWGGATSLIKVRLKIKMDTLYLSSALGFEKALGLVRQKVTHTAIGTVTKPRYPLFCDQICKIYNISINKTPNHCDKVLVWALEGCMKQLKSQQIDRDMVGNRH